MPRDRQLTRLRRLPVTGWKEPPAMANAPAPVPDIGKDPVPSQDSGGSSLDQALREAVLTLEAAAYQAGNPAFSPLTARDWAIMVAAYVAIPVLLALVVGVA